MFYPGSGSLNFSSRIRIPGPGGKKAPDHGSWGKKSTGSRILGLKKHLILGVKKPDPGSLGLKKHLLPDPTVHKKRDEKN
jgi:hypothetical protein